MPAIEVSVGELFDKVSILEIKLDNITDKEKLKYISREFDRLVVMVDEYTKNDIAGQIHYEHLYLCNKELWEVEDELRRLEREKMFGDKFVGLARSVYILNDNRAKIKRMIDELYNSNVREQKSYEGY